ncbi:MAG: hypothetical protein E6H67_14295 [Betaproteobacteria bacterium]|nr:MAG: hypothetical protein E6H67_14295 [Betaproteobacteria bacterium]
MPDATSHRPRPGLVGCGDKSGTLIGFDHQQKLAALAQRRTLRRPAIAQVDRRGSVAVDDVVVPIEDDVAGHRAGGRSGAGQRGR